MTSYLSKVNLESPVMALDLQGVAQQSFYTPLAECYTIIRIK